MKRVMYVLAAVLVGVIISCSKSSDKAVLQVRLTDAPGDFDKVLIDVQDVQIHVASNENEGAWQSLDVNKKVYNLLDFRNGLDTLLGSLELPAGKISQMRLILGANNKIVKNGIEYALGTPSSQQSGLKFNINAELVDGVTYKLYIDFDAAHSIVNKGNGAFSLKPVIRPFTEATSGAIKGIVAPDTAVTKIWAIANGDSTGAIQGTGGKFLFRGLAPATYKVVFEPAAGFAEKVVENVTVSLGEVNDLGTVTVAKN